MNYFDNEDEKDAIQDYTKRFNYTPIIIIIITIIAIVACFVIKDKSKDDLFSIAKKAINNLDDYEYELLDEDEYINDDDIYYDDTETEEEIIHTSASEYEFTEGQMVSFDKYNMIVSLSSISKNTKNKIEYFVSVEAEKQGALGIEWDNSEENYSFWDRCKIELIELNDSSKLKIKITSLEELAKQYKESYITKLELNKPFVIDNNSIELKYNQRVLDGEYNIEVKNLKNKKNTENIVLDRDEGFEFIDDNHMISLEDDSDPMELKVKIYYN